MIFGLIRLVNNLNLIYLCLIIFSFALGSFFVFKMTFYKSEPEEKILYDKFRVLRLSPENNKQIGTLRYLQMTTNQLDFWSEANGINNTIDVMVSPKVLETFEKFLKRKKIRYEVFVEDVQSLIDSNAAEQKILMDDSADYTTISWNKYHRIKEIHKFLNWLSISHPNYVEVIDIGKSFEGRPLRVVKIGRPIWGRDKPAIWIDGGTHAREWIAPATALYIIDQLVNNYTHHRTFVDRIDWFILPVANPDGYEYSHTRSRLWRKSRHQKRGNCVGTDLNRNFGFYWNHVGTNNNPCSEIFPGNKPFSEPETQAIAEFILNHKNIQLFLSLHSYLQLVLCPWGFTNSRPQDYKDLINLGKEAAEAISSVYGTQYKIGSSVDLLYKSSGGATDWAKGIAGIKYTYAIELRDKGKYGFLLPASQIRPTGIETMEGVKIFAKKLLNT